MHGYLTRSEQRALALLFGLLLIGLGLLGWQRLWAPARAAPGGAASWSASAAASPAERPEEGGAGTSETAGFWEGADGAAEPPFPSTALPEIWVHVTGAVVKPGVYRLFGKVRVADAVAAAGGARPDGRPDALNLAAPLRDGERVYVPNEAEWEAARTGSVGTLPWSPPGGPEPLVDLNTADAARLEELPGIGPALAARIVAERERNGPFRAVEDLERVSGIGPAKVAELRDRVTVR